MTGRAWHRARQFFGALRPRVTPADREDAYRHLDQPLRPVFESMTLRDQRHGIVVLRRVLAAGGRADDRDLCAAALLHDCGKGAIALWQRVAHVALPDALCGVIAAERGAAWRRAFWRLRHHPELGARMAAEAGASADVVRMIRQQDAPAPDARLALLQAADEM